MSYTSTRARRRAHKRVGLAGDVADFFDNIGAMLNGGKSEEATANEACLAAANAKSAELDAKASDLSKNWNPTGIYSVAQMQTIVQSTMSMLLASSSAIDVAMAAPMADGARAALTIKRGAIQRKMSTEGLVFTGALGQAMKGGVDVIDAPGLKAWVVNSTVVAADAVSAAYYVGCQTSGWVTALAAFQAAFDRVWAVVKQVAGVAVQLGQQVLKIPDTLSKMWTYATYGAVGLIALWAWENLPKIAEGA